VSTAAAIKLSTRPSWAGGEKKLAELPNADENVSLDRMWRIEPT
jgi:hypothetical protein